MPGPRAQRAQADAIRRRIRAGHYTQHLQEGGPVNPLEDTGAPPYRLDMPFGMVDHAREQLSDGRMRDRYPAREMDDHGRRTMARQINRGEQQRDLDAARYRQAAGFDDNEYVRRAGRNVEDQWQERGEADRMQRRYQHGGVVPGDYPMSDNIEDRRDVSSWPEQGTGEDDRVEPTEQEKQRQLDAMEKARRDGTLKEYTTKHFERRRLPGPDEIQPRRTYDDGGPVEPASMDGVQTAGQQLKPGDPDELKLWLLYIQRMRKQAKELEDIQLKAPDHWPKAARGGPVQRFQQGAPVELPENLPPTGPPLKFFDRDEDDEFQRNLPKHPILPYNRTLGRIASGRVPGHEHLQQEAQDYMQRLEEYYRLKGDARQNNLWDSRTRLWDYETSDDRLGERTGPPLRNRNDADPNNYDPDGYAHIGTASEKDWNYGEVMPRPPPYKPQPLPPPEIKRPGFGDGKGQIFESPVKPGPYVPPPRELTPGMRRGGVVGPKAKRALRVARVRSAA